MLLRWLSSATATFIYVSSASVRISFIHHNHDLLENKYNYRTRLMTLLYKQHMGERNEWTLMEFENVLVFITVSQIY